VGRPFFFSLKVYLSASSLCQIFFPPPDQGRLFSKRMSWRSSFVPLKTRVNGLSISMPVGGHLFLLIQIDKFQRTAEPTSPQVPRVCLLEKLDSPFFLLRNLAAILKGTIAPIRLPGSQNFFSPPRFFFFFFFLWPPTMVNLDVFCPLFVILPNELVPPFLFLWVLARCPSVYPGPFAIGSQLTNRGVGFYMWPQGPGTYRVLTHSPHW